MHHASGLSVTSSGLNHSGHILLCFYRLSLGGGKTRLSHHDQSCGCGFIFSPYDNTNPLVVPKALASIIMKLLPVAVACVAAFVGSDHAAYAYNLFSKSASSPEQQVRSPATSRRSLLSSAAAATTALLLGGSVEDQRGLLGARAALAVEEKAADVLTPLYFGVGVSSVGTAPRKMNAQFC